MKSPVLISLAVVAILVGSAQSQGIPRVAQLYNFTDQISAISVVGDYIYITADGILNLYEIVAPGELRFITNFHDISNLTVVNDNAGYSVTEVLSLYDLSEIEHPRKASELAGFSDLWWYGWLGNYFVLCDIFEFPYPDPSVAIFRLFDVSDIYRPVQLYSFSSQWSPVPEFGESYVLKDTLIYFTQGSDLALMNVADPEHPEVTILLEDVDWKPWFIHSASGLLLAKIRVERSSYPAFIDINHPLNPELAYIFDDFPNPKKFVLKNDLMYITYNDTGFAVLNLEEPLEPQVVVDTYTNQRCRNLTTWREQAVVLEYQGFDYPRVVEFIDFSDPQDLESVEWENRGLLTAMTSEGDNGYVHETDTGLKILDLTEPTMPRQIGAFDVNLLVEEFCVSDGIMYIAAGDSGLVMFDVTDIHNPERIGQYLPGGKVNYINVLGDYAYLLTHDSDVGDTLEILDISNINRPVVLSFFPSIQSFQVYDDRLFVSKSWLSVNEYDISDRANPYMIYSHTFESWPPVGPWINSAIKEGRFIFCTFDWAYGEDYEVLYSGSALNIAEIINPDSTVLRGELDIAHWSGFNDYGAKILKLKDKILFINIGHERINIYSCWNPSRPELIGYLEGSKAAVGMELMDNHALVCTQTGFNVYDCSGVLDIPDPHILPPSSLILSSYPNPFNSTSRVTFSLPSASEVKLTLSDMAGRTVSELLNGQMLPGMHQVQLNGSDLPAGVYVIRLESFDRQGRLYYQGRKAVVIK